MWRQTDRRAGIDLAVFGLTATALAPVETEAKLHTRVWARWYQAPVAVKAGRHYRCRAWVRTEPGFRGELKLWVTDTKVGTAQAKALATDGLWREVVIPDLVPAKDQVAVYLNLMNGLGTAWVDDVELVETGG